MATHVSLTYDTGWVGPSQLHNGIVVQAGDCIAIMVHSEKATGTISTLSSVTDNAAGGTNTYTVRASAAAGDANTTKQSIATAIAKASETLNITISVAAANDYNASCIIVGRPGSGKTFQYVDANAWGAPAGGVARAKSGIVSMSSCDGYAAAQVGPFHNGTWSNGAAGWTQTYQSNQIQAAYNLFTAQTSLEYQADYTMAQNEASGVIAVFKEIDQGGGGGGPLTLGGSSIYILP